MSHVDEGTMHAWLDGELTASEAAAMESHVAECGMCAEIVAEARGILAASSRILSALDAVPARVLPPPRENESSQIAPAPRAVKPSRSARPRRIRDDMLRVAAVIFVAAGGFAIVRAGLVSRDMAPAMSVTDEDRSTSMSHEERAPMVTVAPPAAPTPAPAQPVPPVAGAAGRRSEERAALGTSSAIRRPEAEMQLDAAPDRVAAKVEVQEPASAVTSAAPREGGITAAGNQLRQVETLPLVSRERTVEGTDEVIRSVYQARPGVNVTLEERRAAVMELRQEALTGQGAAARARSAPRAPAAAAAPSAAVSPPAAAPPPAPAVVTWSEGDSRFTLTGPVTREELEQLRQRVP